MLGWEAARGKASRIKSAMSIQQFLNLRMTGDRFEGHAIPLEFLKDLPVLNEMIIEVAKLKFFEDHPDRKRSPRGFTHGTELKLTQIGEGSATLNIDLVTSTNTFLPTTSQTYFETARDTVVDAIRTAEHNEHFAGRIPDKMLSYFDRFGRSLREGEAIEFTTPARTPPAKLTKETRQRLVLGSPAITELTEQTSTWGAVPEADQVAMTFEIQVLDGSRIKAPIAPQHFDIVIEAFKGYKEGARFRFEGIGRFSRDSRHLAFDLIEHISVLDPLDVRARLDEFRSMNDGWLEGGGIAPSEAGLDWLADSFERRYPDDFPLPHAYPTYEGGVRTEWSFGPNAIVLNIDLHEHSAHWLWFDRNSDAECEETLNLDEDRAWQWLAEQIRSKAESE